MELEDGYSLYELLKNGDPVDLEHGGKTYEFVFRGEPVGAYNYLSVTDNNGQQKRFGRGWGSEQVWRALEHLEKGWDEEQVPRYSSYDKSKEEDR